LLALAASAALLPTVEAQFAQQGSKLTCTDASGYPQLGVSVALSADGNTAIAGGPLDSNVGATWVFTRTAGSWAQQGSKLLGAGAVGSSVKQGAAVAVSADGNTVIIGGPGDNNFAGAAWVFTRTAGVWTQQGAKLVGTGAAGAAQQGFSVAISADGNSAMVGGPYDNSSAGAVWVFTRSAGVWVQQGAKLVGTGGVGPGSQGGTVALSADGETAIVGGADDASYVGAVWAFTRSGNAWMQQGEKLVAAGAYNGMGGSVAVSSDGNTFVVGDRLDGGGLGATWVFTRSAGVWAQQGGKLVGSGASGGDQGASVAISGDGNTIAVGGPGAIGLGATWIFARSAGVWAQQGNPLTGTGAGANTPQQGVSVAISGDGSTLLVGGPADAHFLGAAWVFAVSTGPTIAQGGVVDGAAFQPGMAANSWVTIEGTNLAPVTDTWNNAVVNGNLPQSLDGVFVSIGGQSAYIEYISPTQINVLAPNVPGGAVSVTVTTPSGTSPTSTATASVYGPAFFLWPGSQVVATRQDYSLAVENGTFSGSATVAAKPGEVLILWGTGFGPTSPAAPVGVETPTTPTYFTQALPSVTINGVEAMVYGAALAPGFAGLYQVAIQAPPTLSNGTWPLRVSIGGVQSTGTMVLSVQQ
jgi:uncharacterized protein (TIGR03437 family)